MPPKSEPPLDPKLPPDDVVCPNKFPACPNGVFCEKLFPPPKIVLAVVVVA